MPTTKQTIAQWPFERLYVAPFTQRRGFDERSLTYRMVPMEQARQLTGIKVLDSVVDRLIKGPGPKKNPRYRGYTDPKLSATIHKLTGLAHLQPHRPPLVGRLAAAPPHPRPQQRRHRQVRALDLSAERP